MLLIIIFTRWSLNEQAVSWSKLIISLKNKKSNLSSLLAYRGQCPFTSLSGFPAADHSVFWTPVLVRGSICSTLREQRERESEGGSDISSSEASLPGWPAPHPTCSLAGQGRLRVWCDNLRLHWRTGWTRTRPFPGHKNMYENIGIIFIPSKNLFLCEIYLQGFDCSSHICEDCGAPCLYVTHLRQ